MKLQERLGELLIVGFMGQEMNALLAAHICELRPAGLILFRRNIVGPEQLTRLTREIQELAQDELGRPLFLAVDQEGGTVARMPPPFAQLPDAAVLGGRDCESVSHYYGLTAKEMFRVGLNMNLAPVLDVTIFADSLHVLAQEGCESALAEELEAAGYPSPQVMAIPPTLEDVFVTLTRYREGNNARV